MSAPNSRTTLKRFCLRRLGVPVIQINVDDDQIEDCIDDTLQIYQEFHSDAVKRIFLKHRVTSSDVANKYIPITSDSSILYVTRLLPFDTSSIGSGSGWFSAKYQIHLNDISNLHNFAGGMSYYSQIGQFLETMDIVLSGVPLVTFSRHENRLYIHGEWWDSEIKEGDYLVAEVYQVIDPETTTAIYNDRFVKDYLTASIKRQWGQNMSKFDGIELLGGVTISGKDMYREAVEEMQRIEEKMRAEQEMPPDFFVG